MTALPLLSDEDRAGLSPCPFCSGDRGPPVPSASFLGRADEMGTKADVWMHQVRCICGACGPDRDSEAEAIEAWNRRPALTAALPIIERCLAPEGWKLVPVDDDGRPFSDPLIPDAMVFAGAEALDRAEEDLKNSTGPDWDTGMIAVAVYRAITKAAPTLAEEVVAR